MLAVFNRALGGQFWSGADRGDARNPFAERGLLAAASDVANFADHGPSLVIDNGWRHVAESCLSWMDAQEP